MPKGNKMPKKRTQGSKWISRKKRLAVYNRDSLCCAYCGRAIEDGARLSLDHLKPYGHGGSNKETNLVTCCGTCNSSRQDRPWKEFARAVGEYRNVEGEKIIRHIENCRRRKLNIKAAEEIIARRGCWAKVLENNCR